MGKSELKKGDARRLILDCAEEGNAARAILIGPDPDGDVNLQLDFDNEPELEMVLNRENQRKLVEFLLHSLEGE